MSVLMPEQDANRRAGKLVLDRDTEHELRNHLSIIQGYCDVMELEIDPAGTLYQDLLEIKKAAQAARAILVEAERR